MKTVLFDQSIETVVGWYENGYKVDGLPCSVDPPVYELEVIEISPEYNSALQKAADSIEVDLELMQYRIVWTITNKTAFDIAIEAWHYPEFTKRIVAPVELVMQYPAIETWFRINDLPIIRVNTTLYCYCNLILPMHQQLIDALSGIVTVEDIPVPS